MGEHQCSGSPDINYYPDYLPPLLLSYCVKWRVCMKIWIMHTLLLVSQANTGECKPASDAS